MSVRIFSQARNNLIYIFGVILLCSGYYNYFVIAEPIALFFRISSLTGQVLVDKFLSICNCTYEIVKLTYSFLEILYEDSLIFLKDATEKFTFAMYLLKELYFFLEEFFWNFLKVSGTIGDSILTFFEFLQGVVGAVKQGLDITGSAIWCFFAELPKTVLLNIYNISNFLVYTSTEITTSVLTAKEKVTRIIQKTYLDLFDIPLDSVYGLIIGAVILTILCVKFKDICFIVSSAVLKLYQQVVSFGVSLWNGRFLEHKVTPSYSDEDDERLCIVCQYQLKEVIIFPCKHLCLCRECSKHLEKNQPVCPICRSGITGTLKVYI